MAYKQLALAFGMIVATSAAATHAQSTMMTVAPPGTPATRYCLLVEPVTGSRIETIQCRTREDWALLDINVDEEWAENGVRVVA